MLKMKKLEQDIFIHQGASSSITNGNVAEQEAMELLRSFKSVKAVWKDYNNSKFDIYFILEKISCLFFAYKNNEAKIKKN